MFADSLLDSGWGTTSKRGWTTVLSFALQALGIGVLLLLPMIYTQGLPQMARLQSLLDPPTPPIGTPPASRPHAAIAPVVHESNMSGLRLIAPPAIPIHVQMINEDSAPPQVDITGVLWGTSRGPGRDGVVGSTNMSDSSYVLPPPPPAAHQPRVSRMMQGNLIHRVEPTYPPLARQARIQGLVLLRAIISKEGTIENLQVVSGHPLLVQAAVDAVRQWRYRPYVLNGDPVEVETQVTVNFLLSGS